MVLERTGHDLRCRRTPLVHQDHDRHPRVIVHARRPELLVLRRDAAPCLDHGLAVAQEQVAHRNTLVQQPARVLPQVQHQPLHPLRAEVVDRGLQVPRRRLAEHRQLNVPDAAVHQVRQRDGRHADLVPHDPERDRLIHPAAHHAQVHRFALRPPQPVHRLVHGPAARRLAVHLYDPIAGLEARTLRWRVPQRRDHGDPAITDVDLDSQAAVLALRLDPQLLEVLRGHQARVRVAQLVQQPVDRLAVQLRRLLRIDEPVRDVVQHLFEQARLEIDVLFLDPALLQQPAAAGQRQHRDQQGRQD